jgi:hypothetical protein
MQTWMKATNQMVTAIQATIGRKYQRVERHCPWTNTQLKLIHQNHSQWKIQSALVNQQINIQINLLEMGDDINATITTGNMVPYRRI